MRLHTSPQTTKRKVFCLLIQVSLIGRHVYTHLTDTLEPERVHLSRVPPRLIGLEGGKQMIIGGGQTA